MKDDTDDVIKRVQSGDENAFNEIYKTYYKTAFMAANLILSTNKEEAEDVVQETFLYVYISIKNGTEINNIGGFIKICAENKAKDHIKAREATKRPKEVYGTFDESNDDEALDIADLNHSEVQKEIEKAVSFYQSPEDALEESEVSEIVRDILNELPDIQQEPLTLYYLNNMKVPEIAELYGVSEATIKSRLFQGRKKVETKVLEYEKKNKIKLHGLAPLVFFFFLLRQNISAKAMEVPAFSGMVGSVTAKSFFGKSLVIAGKEVSTKLVVGILAAIVGLGSIGAAVIVHNEHKETVLKETKSQVTTDTRDFIPLLENEQYDEIYNIINSYDGETFRSALERVYKTPDWNIGYTYDGQFDGVEWQDSGWYTLGFSSNAEIDRTIKQLQEYQIIIFNEKSSNEELQEKLAEELNYLDSAEIVYENTDNPDRKIYITKHYNDAIERTTEVDSYAGDWYSGLDFEMHINEDSTGSFVCGDYSGTIKQKSKFIRKQGISGPRTETESYIASGDGVGYNLVIRDVIDENTLNIEIDNRSGQSFGVYQVTRSVQ